MGFQPTSTTDAPPTPPTAPPSPPTNVPAAAPPEDERQRHSSHGVHSSAPGVAPAGRVDGGVLVGGFGQWRRKRHRHRLRARVGLQRSEPYEQFVATHLHLLRTRPRGGALRGGAGGRSPGDGRWVRRRALELRGDIHRVQDPKVPDDQPASHHHFVGRRGAASRSRSPSGQPGAFNADSTSGFGGSGCGNSPNPCTAFWGSVSAGGSTISWGADVGWYLAIAAAVLLLVAFIQLWSTRKMPYTRDEVAAASPYAMSAPAPPAGSPAPPIGQCASRGTPVAPPPSASSVLPQVWQPDDVCRPVFPLVLHDRADLPIAGRSQR